MKNINTITTSFLVLTIFITVTTVASAERVTVFELAESGETIMFPMTAEEIAAEDAEKARFDSALESKVTKPEERFHVFEMAESGQTISFPKSAEEIATEDVENAKSKVSASKMNKPQKRVIQFELSESGEMIEFPVIEIEVVTEYTDEIIGDADKTRMEEMKN